jgi:beta-fructofuranosidase
MLALGTLPASCLIETTMRFEAGTQHFGLILRANDTFEQYYRLRLAPGLQRLALDRCPHHPAGSTIVERPLAMTAGESILLRVILDGSCLIAYANDRVALSARVYDYREARCGLFVSEGSAMFEHTTFRAAGFEGKPEPDR